MAELAARRWLSAPVPHPDDQRAVQDALESGWLAPAGPHLEEFEAAVSKFVGVNHAVGLSSGTAAIHLGLKYLGVSPGDVVLVPTLTFGATAFAATYLGATPVFLDVDDSWNLDPSILREALVALRQEGSEVKAIIPVDLYGSPANYSEILQVAVEFEVPVFEDAAEGLGGLTQGRMLGSLGRGAALSFNGNKILTTSGGGMLVTDDSTFADKVAYWSSQSREKVVWYEHKEIGFNYRLSNVLAALGLAQMNRLNQTVTRRREVRTLYRRGLEPLDGVSVQEDPRWGKSNAWLTVVSFDEDLYPEIATTVRSALERRNIESRPVWKPMHQQPVFRNSRSFLNGNADAAFRRGLCLPSGPGITDEDVDEVVLTITETLKVLK